MTVTMGVRAFHWFHSIRITILEIPCNCWQHPICNWIGYRIVQRQMMMLFTCLHHLLLIWPLSPVTRRSSTILFLVVDVCAIEYTDFIPFNRKRHRCQSIYKYNHNFWLTTIQCWVNGNFQLRHFFSITATLFNVSIFRSRMETSRSTNRPSSNPAHLANIMLNPTINVPQYDRSSLVQPQPLVEPHIAEVIDPDDDVVTTAPIRSQNCKLLATAATVSVYVATWCEQLW